MEDAFVRSNLIKAMLSQLRNRWIKRNLRSTFEAIILKTNHKPPNILIKTDDSDQFVKLNSLLNVVLDADRYTVHKLSEQQFTAMSWKDSCCLLMFVVDSCKYTTGKFVENIKNFLQCDGRVIFYSDASSSHKDLVDFLKSENINGKIEDPNMRVAVLQSDITDVQEDLILTLKLMGLHTKTNTPYLTVTKADKIPAYLISFNNMKFSQIFHMDKKDTSCINGKGGKGLVFLRKLEDVEKYESKNKGPEMLVLTEESFKTELFNSEIYERTLRTRQYGRNMIYTETIDSTQTVFTGINFQAIQCDGFVVYANRQLKGKGRSGNQWISPLGCMMFSMEIVVPLDSLLGRNLSIIQHLVVVAFVRSIKTRESGYNHLDLNIKWPNDIYINKTTKIGGVIVNSSCMHGLFKVVIGLGVNVNNEKPTECLNSLIRQQNLKHSYNLPELSMEEALAETVNSIEYLVDLFQEKGVDEFKKEYYRYWMHSGTEVTLESRNQEKAIIEGIDDFGYLKVRLKKNNEEILLQPDGNSFDMMRNLIVIKS